MKNENEKNAAVEVAENEKQSDGIDTNVNGVSFKIDSVASNLIGKVVEKIIAPSIPIIEGQDGQELANPNSPQYIEDMKDYQRKRALASVDAMIMFGLKLVEPIPEDDWLGDLVFMEVLSDAEIEKASDKQIEFWYKKYIVCDNETIKNLSEKTGVTGKSVRNARDSFRGDEKRVSD